MAEVVSYPLAHCIRCWAAAPDFGVLDGGFVIGPYCEKCAEAKADELNRGQFVPSALPTGDSGVSQ